MGIKNPINISGQKLEKEMSFFLESNSIPYVGGGSSCIDFKIKTEDFSFKKAIFLSNDNLLLIKKQNTNQLSLM